MMIMNIFLDQRMDIFVVMRCIFFSHGIGRTNKKLKAGNAMPKSE